MTLKKNDFRKSLENRVRINLNPGDLYIAKEPIVVKTILGSCISVVIYNRRTKIAAISHAQLPGDKKTGECPANCPVKCYLNAPSENMFKYVTHSSKYLLKSLEDMKIRPEEMEIKLFGGANVLDISMPVQTIGDANIETAHRLFENMNLSISKEDTGGNKGRTIYLDAQSGVVSVWKHKRSQNAKIE